MKIGRDLRGGSIAGAATIDSTGYIEGDRIASVSIGGSIIAGIDTAPAARSRTTPPSAPATTSARSPSKAASSATESARLAVIISARGQATLAPGATTDLAIKSLTIGGRVERAKFSPASIPTTLADAGSNGNASIGAVKVGGDWIASSLAAGVEDDGPSGFGDADDDVINNRRRRRRDHRAHRQHHHQGRRHRHRASAADQFFGFTAQQIGSFKSLGFTAPLTAGPSNDVVPLSPTTGDVTLREI